MRVCTCVCVCVSVCVLQIVRLQIVCLIENLFFFTCVAAAAAAAGGFTQLKNYCVIVTTLK